MCSIMQCRVADLIDVASQALKEVYLPVSGLWLSEYPLVNRNLFLDISLDIERQQSRETAEGAYDAVLS